MQETIPVSVVVCTLNEERRIGRLLETVHWADEVVVLDSGSTDRTVEICRAIGATVHTASWPGFSIQKNRAASMASNDWVLSLDADEVVSSTLACKIIAVMSGDLDPKSGYAFPRRGDFLGVLLPDGARKRNRRRQVRLYNRRFSRWNEDVLVHELVDVPGRIYYLDAPLYHLNSLSIDEYFSLFNRYATVEAEMLHRKGVQPSLWRILGMPLARFVWHLAARGEWRYGRAGVAHAIIKATSDAMRYLKLLELVYSQRRDAAPREKR